MGSIEFTTNEQFLLTTLVGLLLVQFIYYLVIYYRIYSHNKAADKNRLVFSEESPPLSVIICAKNESENLRTFLHTVLEQDYPQYEVIVINAGSTDETEDYLKSLKNKYPHLYHSFTPDNSRNISHKKLALTLGIKASKYDWLVFTEANCYPVSKEWLRKLARNFTPGTDVVLGYSGYKYGKGWNHKYISFDNLFRAMRYLGVAIAGYPYMGIGRNMAYRKECFFEQKGFSSHLSLERGEDDLFINKIACKRNTRVETDPQAVIRMKPVEFFKDWYEERLSSLGTGGHFSGIHRYILGFETCVRLCFYAACITGIVCGIMAQHWAFVTISFLIWVIRYALQITIINKTAKSLHEKRRYYTILPVFDIVQIAYSIFFGITRMYRGKQGDGTK